MNPPIDKTKIAIQIFDNAAREYQDKFMDSDLFHESFDLFCQAIKKENAEVLELACGPGNITRYILNKRPDLKVLGTDLSPKMLELAKANNPSAEFQLLDCRDIDKMDKKYDAILCGFGLPYLSKEEAIQLIGNAGLLLNQGGVLYLSTVEGDYANSGFQEPSSGGEPKMYIHFHEADYLLNAMEGNAFEVLQQIRVEFEEGEHLSPQDLVLIGRKE